jgi:hypothetical protein
MYQAQLTNKDRAATFVAVALIHLALAFVLINISPAARQELPEQVVDLLSITEPPAAGRRTAAGPGAGQAQAEEGAASPQNIESKATPVVQPAAHPASRRSPGRPR